jgi:acyl-CoA synthetase (NDP forming)
LTVRQVDPKLDQALASTKGPRVPAAASDIATPAPDLDRLFRPRTVAVVGASDTPDRPATLNWRRVQAWAGRVGGRAIPVNPNRPTVDGVATYPSIVDVPDEVDVAVLLVNDVDDALRDVAKKGVGFVIVFAAGFAEVGGDGVQRQQDLVRILDGSGVRLLGPNTNMNAFEEFLDLPGRPIALITQSGHQGRPVFQGQELGIRFSHWAPTGNEADLGAADFIRYFAELPDTGAIAVYLEGFTDGAAFRSAAARAARQGVPIVMVKVGRTEVGRSWAQSHTGHLAGADDVTSAVLRQYGVTRVDGLDELLDTSALFARAKRPSAPGVCVYSISGGTSAHMADLLTVAGVELPELTPQTQTALREWIPGYLRINNPVDNGGHPVGDWRGRKILDTILADPNIGVLVVPITGAFPPMSDKFVADLIDVSSTTDKPICVVWGSPSGTEDAYRVALLGSQLPVFRTFGNCVGAVRALLDFHAFQDRLDTMIDPGEVPVLPAAPGAVLNEVAAKQLLAEYGVPLTRDVLCRTADDAVTAAAEFAGPVVLKAVSTAIAHKSDLGLVRIGVESADEVRATVADFEQIVAGVAGADYDGTLVCEQISGGVETVVGIATDPVFGPVVMFGIGGVAVEVYRDTTFRVPPFSREEALRMIGEVRGFSLLTGHRGAPPADLEALVDVIMAVQRLAVAGVVTELDVNPLVALPDRAVALDALARGVDHG